GGWEDRGLCTCTLFAVPTPLPSSGSFPATTPCSVAFDTGIVSVYDCIFKRPPGYNEKLHRCDREHANNRGLQINDEEQVRPFAVLSSSVYGRRINQPVEQLIRDYVRINHVQAEFYRKNGLACLTENSSRSVNPS
uniref:Cilia and flagella associated protein 90 n=1 Tax=Sphenodon punctatus TaxID=8508 RepID=A0A8D0G942_SPHPU